LENLLNVIHKCIQNDRREQKVLYEKYYGYCLKTVFRYIYNYDKAVDVVNDGFVKVFKNLYRFEVKTTETLEMMLMGWMRTIMVNTAIDQLRKNSFLPEIGQIPENSWTQEDKSQSSDQRILYKELVKEIRKLPPGYRAVFNMYMIDGFTHQEIATQLNITTGTSKSNLSKARVILQRILKIGEQEAVLCSI